MNPTHFLRRRQFVAGAAAGLAATVLPARAADDAWPGKVIKMVVAFPPGGPTDTAARIVAQGLSARLGQSVIVENRSGASGSIGTASFIKSPADGYTLSMFGMPALLAPLIYKNNLYDVRKDFVSVATVYDLPMAIMVNPQQLPDVHDLKQLVQAAKSAKVPLNYTSSGTGSFGHLSMEQLKDMAGFDMQHVAYRGSAPAIVDLLGGQVSVMFADVVAGLAHIQSGKLRAIAVSSARPSALLPGVKPIAAQGFPGFDADTWGGLIAPLGTPAPVLARLNKELAAIMADPDVQQRLLGAGAIAAYAPGATMQKRLLADYARWSRIATEKNISTS